MSTCFDRTVRSDGDSKRNKRKRDKDIDLRRLFEKVIITSESNESASIGSNQPMYLGDKSYKVTTKEEEYSAIKTESSS